MAERDDDQLTVAPVAMTGTTDDPDALVAEVRAARAAIFAAAGQDFAELGRQLRARQAAAGRVGITLPPKAPDEASDAA